MTIDRGLNIGGSTCPLLIIEQCNGCLFMKQGRGNYGDRAMISGRLSAVLKAIVCSEDLSGQDAGQSLCWGALCLAPEHGHGQENVPVCYACSANKMSLL